MRNQKEKSLAWAVVVCTLPLMSLFKSSVEASVGQALSLKYLSETATNIVQGKVENIRFDVTNGGAQVFTLVDIVVQDRLKGSASSGDRITIKVLGGQNGNNVTVPVGGETFRPEEEVVLFLVDGTGPYFSGHQRVIGLSQGKFSIEKDASGQKIVRRSLSALKLVGPQADDLLRQERISLDELKSATRSHIKK